MRGIGKLAALRVMALGFLQHRDLGGHHQLLLLARDCFILPRGVDHEGTLGQQALELGINLGGLLYLGLHQV